MKKYILILCIALAGISANAQTASSGAAPIDPLLKGRELISQLVVAFDASTFLNSWTAQDRAQWNSELANASSAADLSKCISELVEYIRPNKFSEQFSVAQLKSLASNTKNYGDVANVLATLQAGLKSEAFINDWVSRESSWLGELKLVK